MVSRKLLAGAIVVCLLVAVAGLMLALQQRVARCAYVPLLADNLLPNADMSITGDTPTMPQGWSAAAPGVQLGTFAVDGDERALQLIGIANFVQAPAVSIEAGQRYCITGRAMTDSEKESATRLRIGFHWLNGAGETVRQDTTTWQPVVLWRSEAPPDDWSHIQASFAAPPQATTLLVRFHPASDDRIYLDAVQVRRGGAATATDSTHSSSYATDSDTRNTANLPVLEPWPHGYRAAVSFSFDWETAMGGLVHSRSVGDPYTDMDPEVRGMRMREGITTTLALFRPYNVRATYYATGYNFLPGNTARRQFLDNPTYAWASTENHWTADHWQTTPWFAPDPYGTVQSHPAWYFGDLVPLVQREGHDIQSHTFSHFYGGFVSAHEWQRDMVTWSEVAALRGVPPARSLAFPWSSSGGMSDANWQVLEQAGIRSVTRTSSQSQYRLFARDTQSIVGAPHCRPVPGHERILACPDFYLTPASVEQALEQVDHVLQTGGMIDFWAHTEEVISEEQRSAWERVVQRVATDERLWVAPMREIADWQQARMAITIEHASEAGSDDDVSAAPLTMTLYNGSDRDLEGATLRLPFAIERIHIQDHHGYEGGEAIPLLCDTDSPYCRLTINAGQRVTIQAWHAAASQP